MGYAFLGGGSMGECGVHQDIGWCSGHMAALALSPGCIHSEEYGEAMLRRLCAQWRIWTTITSPSGTCKIFVTLS